MATKLTRMTHEIAIQLHLVAESCTIYSSRSRLPVWKLLDTPSYNTDQNLVSELHDVALYFALKVETRKYTKFLHVGPRCKWKDNIKMALGEKDC
jgi:hypothetical protein